MVGLAEAVQLVPADVEDQAVVHRGGLKKTDRMSLVQLQDGYVEVKAPVPGDLRKNGGQDPPDKVAAGLIGKDFKAPGGKEL